MAKILAIVIVSLMIGASLAQTTTADKWAQFKGKHGKTYKDKNEETRRKQKFLETDAKIEKHNKEFAAGKKSFEMGHNQFSDLDEDEKKAFLGHIDAANTKSARSVSTSLFYSYLRRVKHFVFKRNTSVILPTSIDYRTKWNVTARNQGGCGSCWAFSAAGALEAALKIKKNVTVDLSEQKLVDCAFVTDRSATWPYGGCKGGYVGDAMDYIIKNPLSVETAWPYSGTEKNCTNSTGTRYTLKDYYHIDINNEEAMKEALVTLGPVSICFYASVDTFYSYKSGIWDGKSTAGVQCPTTCNHAVLLIGYGVENGIRYYLVRNSWGPGWGIAGNFKIKATGTNLCAIASDAYVPVV